MVVYEIIFDDTAEYITMIKNGYLYTAKYVSMATESGIISLSDSTLFVLPIKLFTVFEF